MSEGIDLNRLEDQFATSPPHIFHAPSEVRQLMAARRGSLGDFTDFVARSVRALTDPAVPSFHLWHLMPPPGYEFVWGLRLTPLDVYTPPFTVNENGMLVLQLDIRSRTTVDFGGKVFRIKRNPNNRYVVECDGNVQRTDESSVYLTKRLKDGSCYFAVNGSVISTCPSSDAGAEVRITCDAGACYIVSGQSLDGSGCFLQFLNAYAGDERISQISSERNPFRFDWGLRSCALLNMLIGIAVASDIVRGLQNLEDHSFKADYELLSAVISAPATQYTLEFLLEQFLKWPFWRPAAGEYPEQAAWDRNSFTNGTLPAIVAILARLTGRETDPLVVERFHDRGTSFLNSAARGSFLEFSARDSKHWVRRSANHGLIMLSAYMIAARLLNQWHRPDIQKIDLTLGLALHEILEDGSFCEGVAYEFFALSYILPYIYLSGFDHVYDDNKSFKSLKSLFSKSFDWVSLSHDSKGSVFANFGDNFTDTVRRVSTLALLQSCSQSRLEIPASYMGRSDELFSFVPDPIFASHGGRRIENRLYSRNNLFLAAAYSEQGARESGLFVIGSRLQLTHNKNHDCGGFAFYWNDSSVLFRKSDRRSHFNNSFGLKKGGVILAHRGPRSYNGSVEIHSQSDEFVRLKSFVSMDSSFVDEAGNVSAERAFLYRPYEQVPLIVETCVRAPGHLQPFLALQLDGIGERDDTSSKWCRTFCRDKDAWLELTALELDRLSVFERPAFSSEPETVFVTLFGEGAIDIEPLLPKI